MALEQWIRNSSEAVNQLEAETGRRSGGSTGWCHRLLVATFGDDGAPPEARTVREQKKIEFAYGISRKILPDSGAEALERLLRDSSGRPIVLEGFPPGVDDELHIAAVVVAEDGLYHIFDSTLPGGYAPVASSEGVQEWAAGAFAMNTVVYSAIG